MNIEEDRCCCDCMLNMCLLGFIVDGLVLMFYFLFVFPWMWLCCRSKMLVAMFQWTPGRVVRILCCFEQSCVVITNWMQQRTAHSRTVEYPARVCCCIGNSVMHSAEFKFPNFVVPVRTGGGVGCFNGDALVLMSDGSQKCARDVCVGDEVMSSR
jgi:hypothetical protein